MTVLPILLFRISQNLIVNFYDSLSLKRRLRGRSLRPRAPTATPRHFFPVQDPVEANPSGVHDGERLEAFLRPEGNKPSLEMGVSVLAGGPPRPARTGHHFACGVFPAARGASFRGGRSHR